MARKKALKVSGVMRIVLAANVAALVERRLPAYGDKIKELARRAGMSRSSVQRMASAQHGASIDLIEHVANALGVTAYQLILPGLDPANPQDVAGALEALAKARRQWKRTGAT